MVKSLHSSMYLEDVIQEENIVDYDIDTVLEEGETPEPATSASCEPSRIAPNPISGTKHGSSANSVACLNHS